MKSKPIISARRQTFHVLGFIAAGLAAGSYAEAALAQSTTVNAPALVNPPSRTGVTPVAPSLPTGDKNTDCLALDELKYPGRENNVFPSACDTIDADWKFRKTLADYGILTSLQVAHRISYDLLGHNTPAPVYAGQDVTDNVGLFLEIVYDLSRIGLPDGSRFAFGPTLQRGNFSGAGPNAGGFNELSAFVPVLHDSVEIQIGYEEWQNVFYGSNLGTSSASSALGPNSNIQTEVGLATFIASPGMDIRFWAPDHHLYDHFGVSRSAAPNGAYAYDTGRGPGLEAIVPGTGAIFVNEIGYRIPRGRDNYYFWLRAGAMYNNTEFADFDHNGAKSRGNQGFYLTGDFQLTKPSREQFSRGLYLNFKTDAAPADRNLYADDVSFSLYDIGPFAMRPRDTAAIGITFNRFSSAATDYFTEHYHAPAPRFSTTAIGSYNIHIARGLFLVNALSWVRHPSGTKTLPDAFVGTDSLNFLF